MEKSIEECCNSGCNNCVLDRQQNASSKCAIEHSKINLFDRTYRVFKLISRQICTVNVHKFRFKIVSSGIDEEKYTIDVPPTCHLFIRIPSDTANTNKNDENTKENYISRPYTPITVDDNQLSFDILVKFEQNGRMSSYFEQLKIGDISEWKGYYGDFMWSANPTQHKYLVCICQGVAIAPIYTLVSSILSDEKDETLIYLLVCFKDLDNYLLRNELAEFRKFWNFHAIVYLSQFNHYNEQCTEKRTKNCLCLKPFLRYDETICPYRLNQNELKRFYSERGSNLIFTLFCGTNSLENLVKSCSVSEMGTYFCIK